MIIVLNIEEEDDDDAAIAEGNLVEQKTEEMCTVIFGLQGATFVLNFDPCLVCRVRLVRGLIAMHQLRLH